MYNKNLIIIYGKVFEHKSPKIISIYRFLDVTFYN